MVKIYTHDEAAILLDLFESVLDRYDIVVPSPEDDEREPDNDAKLYGSVYSELLDETEAILVDLLKRHDDKTEIVEGVFSGTV